MLIDNLVRPTFIISFDSEAKWGHTERLSPDIRRILRTEPLGKMFRDIVALLDSFGMRATFAFVGGMTLEPDQYLGYIRAITASPCAKDFLDDVARSELEGWFCPKTIGAVLASGRHEIACHSFTHVRFDTISREAAELEIAACVSLAKSQGIDLKSFVFPRGRVAHLDLLPAHGFTSYRAGMWNPTGTVLGEFNVFADSEPHAKPAKPLVAVPAGRYLNWRSGARLLVPQEVTLERWRHILDDAVRHNGVAHCWLKPHNLLNGKDQFSLLENVLREVQVRVADGRMDAMTHGEYARAVADRSPGAIS
jgi:peptidoglycan/xylan/chitin deacetylase (PgdA/CDA1 family)